MTVTTAKASVVPNQQRVTKRMHELLNLLNLHFAGVAVLAVVCLYLLVQIFVAWNAATSQNAEALAQQTVTLKTAEIAAKQLQGLDDKLVLATAEADKFYGQRLPFAYSEVAGELGALAKKQGVKLVRVNYAEAPVMEGTQGALTEVQMDASLNGDYRPLVLFVNGLERDKMFFLIGGVTLTGQQSGTVGLRLRLVTYLRAPMGPESSEKTVIGPNGEDAVGGTLSAPGSSGVPR